jgi:hypothetical protein
MSAVLSRRAGVALLSVAAVQLLLSVRFFHKYVDRPVLGYALWVSAGLLVCGVVLSSRRLLTLLTRPWLLGAGVAALTALVAVSYPRADALRAQGRGSDQDDCVRTLVANVFAGRKPFGRGYFGDPCSTGPSEFLWYFPVQVSGAWFVAVPALAMLLGWWVLSLVADRGTAVLLSLSQLASWLFLELSAVGSDLLVIGWLFAAAVVLVRERRAWRWAVGGAAYVLFAGSRLPLALVAAASLWLLVVAVGWTALRVVVPVLLATAGLYAGGWAAAPDSFTPGHLVGKSLHILRYLSGSRLAPALVVAALLVGAGAAVTLVPAVAARVRRHWFAANVLVIALPMWAVAVWDLSRRDLDPARWEGLGYLYLCVPMLLVGVADWLRLSGVDRPPRRQRQGERAAPLW